MSPKVGRPPIDNPKNVRLEIRLTKEQSDEISELAEKLDISRTDVVLRGVQLLVKETY